MAETCSIVCGPSCEWIFERIRVWPLIEGGTRVEWTLHPQFSGPTPHTFQLQFGRTGNPEADDWANVGLPAENAFFAIDDSKRAYGKFQWVHYRILLTDGTGTTYASKPQHSLGSVSKRDWLRAREILRLETLRLHKEAGQDGYLLKRRLFGEECTCLDTQTKESRNPQCEDCYGTGFLQGYYDPYPCFFVEMSTSKTNNHRDEAKGRGTVDDSQRVSGRMINIPQVFSSDVWIDKDSDFRWMIRSINNIVEVRGMPIVLKAEMRLLPYTHPVYKIEIEDQLPE